MKICGPIGGWLKTVALTLVLAASPAHAERLTFDHRLYPPLKQVLDSGDTGMIDFNAKNPAYVVDLIAIKGKSAADWTEAVKIISRLPARNVKSAQSWLDEQSEQTDKSCAVPAKVLEATPASVTFERDFSACQTAKPAYTLGRIIAGKRSLFEIAFLFSTVPASGTRDQALALLASARLD